MQYLFYVLAGLIYLPVGIYLYYFFRRLWKWAAPDRGNRISRILCAAAALVCIGLAWPIYGLGAVIVLYFLAVCLIMDLLHQIFGKRWGGRKRRIWNVLRCSGFPGLLVILLAFSYGFVNMRHVTKKEYTVTTEKLANGERLKIAAITDLHLGTTMDASELQEWCEKIGSEEPDLLVLVGDIFDENTKKEQMEQAAEILAQVPSTYGTYYVWGNHDPNWYTDQPQYTLDELCEKLEDEGIRVLEDEVWDVSDQFCLIGRRDASAPQRTDLEELTENIEPDKMRILLDHQPGDLKENEQAGIDLQISGHTHAGQIWPTGQLMELMGINEINYGYRQMGNLQVIVSSGMAGWGYPIRTGGHCEYVMIQVVGT